jgi:hypothetical protein
MNDIKLLSDFSLGHSFCILFCAFTSDLPLSVGVSHYFSVQFCFCEFGRLICNMMTDHVNCADCPSYRVRALCETASYLQEDI